MNPQPYDLFGQVIITHHDIDLWLRNVPQIRPDSPRAAWYVKAYSVTEKIRAAKIAGTFDRLTADPEPAAHWWHRFNWR